MPQEFTLGRNFPNPFNPSTKIGYEIPAESFVTLTVFDVLGREAAVLVRGAVAAGRHTVMFDASRFTAGVYMYRL